jgi:hypothetical protein
LSKTICAFRSACVSLTCNCLCSDGAAQGLDSRLCCDACLNAEIFKFVFRFTVARQRRLLCFATHQFIDLRNGALPRSLRIAEGPNDRDKSQRAQQHRENHQNPAHGNKENQYCEPMRSFPLMWKFLATLNAGAQTFAGSLWVELKAKPEAVPSHRLFRRSSGPMDSDAPARE